ncbi:MAG: 1-deoxy-D-xylulose-5-phosphate reductoisomerase [Phycisphaerales bacterium]|nr:1-deoxy-D-xylulose-5-phosphate reductoisomerase [Planctomycetota bacterium]MCH8508142.1 1-deoxy-D-xylulose-5-phosphate reductoisomerase [Phycisphaerales bacterium]
MPSTKSQPAEPTPARPVRARRVVVLGSAGSIGTQTLDAIGLLNRLHAEGRFPHPFEVVGLATGTNAPAVLEQAADLGVRDVALACEKAEADGDGLRLRRGPDAAERLVREVDCDLVVGAIVGTAGLPALVAALGRGVDVALANKETLVAAGSVIVPLAAKHGARLLPVDSEHAGVWQCLMSACGPDYSPPRPAPGDVARVVLTASGGAFRDRSPEDVADATPEQALAHPTWDMGAKVTVDTATLVNKALELIEAHWLFGLGADRLGAVIHPTSTVHALVEMGDGSVVAQLGAPDMRTPIARALAFPHRCPEAFSRLDLRALGSLEFREIRGGWGRAIELGLWAVRAGGDAGAVFNAANEAAVQAFLDRRIPFGRILDIVESVCDGHRVGPVGGIGDVLDADVRARALAMERIGGGS